MKTTTQSQDPDAFAQLQAIVRDIDVAMITTVTANGALHSRPMVTRHFDDDGELWFLMSDEAAVAQDLETEHAVNLSYADPRKRRYVSVTGNATMLHDADKARELWDDALEAYFPLGLDDPHLALLRVRIESAEFWESPSGKAMTMFPAHEDGGSDTGKRGEHTKVDVRATPASG